MKDRLTSALTALETMLPDAVSWDALSEGVGSDEASGSSVRVGLWACPLEVAQLVKRFAPAAYLAPRTDSRTDFNRFAMVGLEAQSLRPDVAELVEQKTHAPRDQAAIIFPVSSKSLTLGLVAAAVEMTEAGAPVLMAGTKDQGMDSVAKRLRELGLSVEKRSKAHAVALQFSASHGQMSHWIEECRPSHFLDENGRKWSTCPGVFSHGRIDRGSRVLRDHMPALSGAVADFGAGWGALAPSILGAGADEVCLHEASAMACELARDNLQLEGDQVSASWCDLEAEGVNQTFNHVVMNPPFHSGKLTRSSLGGAFIKRAHEALKPGGSLTLVANVHLGYEHVLSDLFGQSEQLARQDGFKVLRAVRKR
ncbi:MAG: methyltransferase [Pseudomonadota bacterium]